MGLSQKIQRLQITIKPALTTQAEGKNKIYINKLRGNENLGASPLEEGGGRLEGALGRPKLMLVEILQQMLFKPNLLKNVPFNPNKDHFLLKFITLFILALEVNLFSAINKALFLPDSQ